MVPLALLPLVLVKVGEVWSPFAAFRLLGISYMTFRAPAYELPDTPAQKVYVLLRGDFPLQVGEEAAAPVDRGSGIPGQPPIWGIFSP